MINRWNTILLGDNADVLETFEQKHAMIFSSALD